MHLLVQLHLDIFDQSTGALRIFSFLLIINVLRLNGSPNVFSNSFNTFRILAGRVRQSLLTWQTMTVAYKTM